MLTARHCSTRPIWVAAASVNSFGDVGGIDDVDSSGNVYVAGYTYSADFPTTPGAFQTVNHAAAIGGYNAFVTKLNAAGSALIYSTYLGGSGDVSLRRARRRWEGSLMLIPPAMCY